MLMAQEDSHDVRYAGFADRMAAFIIDAIIVGTLFCYLLEGAVYAGGFISPLLFAGTAAAFGEPEMPVIIGSAVAATILLFLLCWLYSAGVTGSSYSATFGKMIMGMKVTDVLGNRLSFWHATIRFIAKIFSGLILFIGFFMIHYSEKKQGLHDRFAGTYVVYVKKTPPLPPGAGPTVITAMKVSAEKKEEQSRSDIRKGLLFVGLPLLILVGLAVLSLIFLGASSSVPEHRNSVAVSVHQTDASSLVIAYHGGRDAADLRALEITVNDGTPVTWDLPSVEERRNFPGATTGKDRVVVTGIFSNGDRQVILDMDI